MTPRPLLRSRQKPALQPDSRRRRWFLAAARYSGDPDAAATIIICADRCAASEACAAASQLRSATNPAITMTRWLGAVTAMVLLVTPRQPSLTSDASGWRRAFEKTGDIDQARLLRTRPRGRRVDHEQANRTRAFGLPRVTRA